MNAAILLDTLLRRKCQYAPAKLSGGELIVAILNITTG